MNDDRQMFEGNWKCSKCNNPITQLPFQPDPTRLDQLTCRDCHKARQNNGGFQRQMHQGNWKCSKCNGDITQLPFEPSPDRLDQLQCLECYRK